MKSAKTNLIECPECGRKSLEVSEDDILTYGPDGIPMLSPENAPGICQICRHRTPGGAPPSLLLSDLQSVNDYIVWYNNSPKDRLTYQDMNRARLCALYRSDNDAADQILLDWAISKIAMSRQMIESVGGSAANLRDQIVEKAKSQVKSKCLELSDEEALEKAEDLLAENFEMLNEILGKSLGVPTKSNRFILDDLVRVEEHLDYLEGVIDTIVNNNPWNNHYGNNDKSALLACLDVTIMRGRLWTAWDPMFTLLHPLSDGYWGILEYFDYTWFVDEYLDIGHLGYNAIAVTLFARGFAQLWPSEFEKTLAMRVATNVCTSYIRLSAINDKENERSPFGRYLNRHEEEYCKANGFPLRVSVEEYLLEHVLDISNEMLTWDMDDLDDSDLTDVVTSVTSLADAIRSRPELEVYYDSVAALLDVLKFTIKLKKASSRLERDAVLHEFETHVLEISKDPVVAIEKYVSVFENIPASPRSNMSFCAKSILDFNDVLDPTQRRNIILVAHPAFMELGERCASRALNLRIPKSLESRILKIWPRLAKQRVLDGLDLLLGLGHDHIIQMTKKCVDEERSFASINMLEIGEKVARLERAMRQKLRLLYGDSRQAELERYFQETTRSDRESPLDRMLQFKDGMDARSWKAGEISILDFVTFGDLRLQLWLHTKPANPSIKRPGFKHSDFYKETDLTYHSRIITAFRNAWAHHQPIESGFDEFEKSYLFITTWVNSLETLEQD